MQLGDANTLMKEFSHLRSRTAAVIVIHRRWAVLDETRRLQTTEKDQLCQELVAKGYDWKSDTVRRGGINCTIDPEIWRGSGRNPLGMERNTVAMVVIDYAERL